MFCKSPTYGYKGSWDWKAGKKAYTHLCKHSYIGECSRHMENEVKEYNSYVTSAVKYTVLLTTTSEP